MDEVSPRENLLLIREISEQPIAPVGCVARVAHDFESLQVQKR